MKPAGFLVKLILWLQPAVLMVMDTWVALHLYRYAWTLREPGWFLFSAPLAKLYTDVPHEDWLVVVSLLLAFQIFGLYQLYGCTILRLLFGLVGATVLQTIFLTQFMTLSRGGPEEFPRSVFVVLGILLLAVVPLYRLPLWLAFRFGLKSPQARPEAAVAAPQTDDFRSREPAEAAQPEPAGKSAALALDEMEALVRSQQQLAERINQLEKSQETLRSKLFRLRTKLLEGSAPEAAQLRRLLRTLEEEEWEVMGQLIADKVLFARNMHDIRKAREKVRSALLHSERELELQQLKGRLGTDFAGEDMQQQVAVLGADVQAKQKLLRELESLAHFGRTRVLGLQREKGVWSAVRGIAFHQALRIKHFLYRRANFAPGAARFVTRDFPTFCIFMWSALYLLCFLLLLANLVMAADIIASFAFLLLLAAVAGWTYEYLRHSRQGPFTEDTDRAGTLDGPESISQRPGDGPIY